MTKRILFVSIAFPPKGDPECIQAGRYFYELSKNPEMTIDVVTSGLPTLFMPMDKSLLKYAKISGQLVEIPIYEFRYLNLLLRMLAPGFLSKPDSKMTFHWQWKTVVNKIKIKPDVIYSRSYPLSSTLMAKRLAEYYQVPWVLHLSDPWTENILHKYTVSEIKYHSSQEVECFKLARVISFTSDKALGLYQNKYPEHRKKMCVFPNVYDPVGLGAQGKVCNAKNNKCRIVYTGGLGNTRNAKPLLEAFHQLYVSDSSVVDKVEVIFAGDMDRHNRRLFEEFQLPFVKHLGLVTANRAIELQHSANLLVVIDSKISDKKKAVFLPSKLLDYASLGKPILAITDAESATSEFIDNYGGICFTHSELIKMSDWLASFLVGAVKLQTKSIDEKFKSTYQANRLTEKFKSIT